MANKVVSGDYEKKAVGVYGGVPQILIGFNPKNNIIISRDTVDKYEVVDRGEKKRAGRAVAGAILAGPLGLAAGALSAKTKGVLIAVKFKDGKKSLIEGDKKVCEAIQKNCFEF